MPDDAGLTFVFNERWLTASPTPKAGVKTSQVV